MFKRLTTVESIWSLALLATPAGAALVTYLISKLTATFPILDTLNWEGWLLIGIFAFFGIAVLLALIAIFAGLAYRVFKPAPRIPVIGLQVEAVTIAPIKTGGNGWYSRRITLKVNAWSSYGKSYPAIWRLRLSNGKIVHEGKLRKLQFSGDTENSTTGAQRVDIEQSHPFSDAPIPVVVTFFTDAPNSLLWCANANITLVVECGNGARGAIGTTIADCIIESA